jgi:hypothetical protein
MTAWLTIHITWQFTGWQPYVRENAAGMRFVGPRCVLLVVRSPCLDLRDAQYIFPVSTSK